MALAIPQQRKQIRQIQIEKQRVPVDQIIAVKGKSMWSPAIETAGNVIGQVLARRAENRRQGEELAALEKASGQEPGAYKGLTPEMAFKFAEQKTKSEQSQGSGYFIPRGVDPETNRPIYSHSKTIGLFYDDMTPYKGAGVGALSLKSMTGEMLDKEDAYTNLGFSAKKVREFYSDDLVGPVSARIGRGKQYVEGISTPEAANFYSQLSDLKNQIIYLKSGKQINENEYKRLLDALPNEYMSPTDFKTRLGNFEQIYSTIMDNRRRNLSKTGYRVPSGLENPFKSSELRPLPMPGQGGGAKVATMRWNRQTNRLEPVQ